MILADVHSDFLVWHDQFKTAVLAQAATADWSAGVIENWSDAPTRWLPNNPIIPQSITPILAALGSLLGIEGPQDTTDLTTSKP